MAALRLFQRLYGHRDLVVQFTRREIEVRHKGSRLGHLWSLLRPLSLLVLYLFVFRFIFGGSFRVLPHETFLDFAVAMFIGISLYNVIAEPLAAAPILIISQPNLVKKVVFPLEIIPIANVATSVWHSLLSIAVALIIAAVGHASVVWPGLIALPLLMLPLGLLALGVTWAFAAVGVFVRDVAQLIPFLANAIMYASAVVYSPYQIHGIFWKILRFNPLLQVVNECRKVLLWHLPPDPRVWVFIYVVSLAVFLGGYGFFALLRPFFAEVI